MASRLIDHAAASFGTAGACKLHTAQPVLERSCEHTCYFLPHYCAIDIAFWFLLDTPARAVCLSFQPQLISWIPKHCRGPGGWVSGPLWGWRVTAVTRGRLRYCEESGTYATWAGLGELVPDEKPTILYFWHSSMEDPCSSPWTPRNLASNCFPAPRFCSSLPIPF